MEEPSSRPIRDNSFISPAQQTSMTTETKTGVKEVGEMALNFTQRNIASSFEFAEPDRCADRGHARRKPTELIQGRYLRAPTPGIAAVE